MMAPPLLHVDELEVGYGQTRVLKGVSLSLEEGQALAVLGANGAGKTTLMSTIAGLHQAWAGSVRLDGEDISAVPAEDRVALGIAMAPEGRGIFTTLSIEENLTLGSRSLKARFGAADGRRMAAETLDRIYGMFEVLGRRRKDPASNLSGGQQQMLAIGRALMARPRVLLLDEPCLGLAPKVGNEVYAALSELRSDGQGVIVVEESSRRALDFADRACVLKLGVKVLEDDAAAMQGDDRLLDAYFDLGDLTAKEIAGD
jgi:branched-chain amino acid transport system ATP-binding protein